MYETSLERSKEAYYNVSDEENLAMKMGQDEKKKEW